MASSGRRATVEKKPIRHMTPIHELLVLAPKTCLAGSLVRTLQAFQCLFDRSNKLPPSHDPPPNSREEDKGLEGLRSARGGKSSLRSLGIW